MSLGSDLHLVTRDSSASPAERAPRQLPGWDKECSPLGLAQGAKGKQEELLKPASPITNIPADGDEQLCTRGCSPPRTQTGPQPGHAGVWGGLQAGQMASLRNETLHLLHLQRRWIWVTRDQDGPLDLCREMGLWDLRTATADQQVPGRLCPRGTSARTHTGEGCSISTNPPCRDTRAGGIHGEIQTWGEFQLLKNLAKLEEEQMILQAAGRALQAGMLQEEGKFLSNAN